MQALELIAIGSGALVVVAWLMTRGDAVRLTDRAWSRAIVGVLPGMIGAVLILVAVFDIFPDDLEDGAWLGAVIVVSAVAVMGTLYRVVHR